MKRYNVFYRFKGKEFMNFPMNQTVIESDTKKNARIEFIKMMAEGEMSVKVIKIVEI